MNDTRHSKALDKLTGPALQRAYENALHALDRDAAILDQLRARANILLAALAIGVTALGAILASATLHPHLPVWFVVLAVVFLGSAMFCCVGVLWPVRDHGEFHTAPELKRASDEAAAAALIKTEAAERDAEIAAGRKAIGQARAHAEVLIRAAELELAARAAGLELTPFPNLPPAPPPHGSPPPPEGDAAIAARAQGAIRAARTCAGGDDYWDIEDSRAIQHARESSMARDEQREQDAEAEKSEQARAGAEAQDRADTASLTKVPDLAEVHAVVQERRPPLRKRAGRARERFAEPWKDWARTLGRDQRLWKTVLNRDDLALVPLGGPQDEVDRVLLESMYLAHKRNNGTLSRRADLLRFASLFVLAFVIAFGIWL